MGLQQCVKYIIYIHIECVVLNVAVGKRGVKTRKLFLNILLIMMIITTQNSKVYQVFCLEALLDDQTVPELIAFWSVRRGNLEQKFPMKYFKKKSQKEVFVSWQSSPP